jgi:hypothetical protein
MGSNLLLLNGRVYTFDPVVPEAQAVAIRDTRIAALGNSDDLRRLASDGDWQIVDLSCRVSVIATCICCATASGSSMFGWMECVRSKRCWPQSPNVPAL